MWLSVLLLALAMAAHAGVFPGATWQTKTPAEVGLDAGKLADIATYLGGRGCITRYGYMVYTWGDPTSRRDVASACKPWFSHFLFEAVEDGTLPGDTQKVELFEPRLHDLNAGLGYKDRDIEWWHLANQCSCYGVREDPAAAYDYSDYNMALFFDTLFLNVYSSTWTTVDAEVLHPMLTDVLQCEDTPTFMAFGTGDRPGRVGVSARDFCRFGLLYLNKGDWNGTRLLAASNATKAVTSPLPNSIPRTLGQSAEMISGQRSIGGGNNQTDHNGSYSYAWWLNGVDRDGNRVWPDAPHDVYTCLGHTNGKRGMGVMPSLDIVLSWNDTSLDSRPCPPHPLNTVFKLLVEADMNSDDTPPAAPGGLAVSHLP